MNDIEAAIRSLSVLRRQAEQMIERCDKLEVTLHRVARYHGVEMRVRLPLPPHYPEDTDREARRILDVVVGRYAHRGITVDHIIGKSRVRHVVRVRQLAMYLGREMTGASYPHLGHVFRRDHAAVMQAVRRVSWLYETEPGARAEVDALRKEIAG